MTAGRKLPPQVTREMLRHVQKRSAPVANSTAGTSSVAAGAASWDKLRQRRSVLFGCLAFTGFAASIPFLAMNWIGPLNSKDDALTPAQVRRGPFLNSGSRDIGKDPKWNFANGTYQHDPDLFKNGDRSEVELGEEYTSRTSARR